MCFAWNLTLFDKGARDYDQLMLGLQAYKCPSKFWLLSNIICKDLQYWTALLTAKNRVEFKRFDEKSETCFTLFEKIHSLKDLKAGYFRR